MTTRKFANMLNEAKEKDTMSQGKKVPQAPMPTQMPMQPQAQPQMQPQAPMPQPKKPRAKKVKSISDLLKLRKERFGQ